MQIYDPKVFTSFTVITTLFTLLLVENTPVNTQLSQAHRLSKFPNV